MQGKGHPQVGVLGDGTFGFVNAGGIHDQKTRVVNRRLPALVEVIDIHKVSEQPRQRMRQEDRDLAKDLIPELLDVQMPVEDAREFLDVPARCRIDVRFRRV